MAVDEAMIEISPGEARDLVQQGGAVLVDVREPHEWLQGHAAGARHIPLDHLASRADELPGERVVLCICRSGRRSLIAAERLRSLGRDARSVAGGTLAWAEQELPLETE